MRQPADAEFRSAMMGSDRQLWSGMLGHLKVQHPALCRQWFHEIEPLGIDGGVLRLRAQSVIHRDYLQRQCGEPFADAARTVSKHLLTVQFLGPSDEVPKSRTPSEPTPELKPRVVNENGQIGAAVADHNGLRAAAPRTTTTWELTSKPMRNEALSLVINPDYSFENFIVGPENRLAHAAALAVAANPGKVYNPFFIHGGVGLGKTHLLQAVCLRIKEHNPEARVYYTSCEGFITQFMDAVQAGEMAGFRHRFRDVDLLVIDDVHFLAKRDRSQEEFFHTFNSLYQAHMQIVLSSDAPPEEIPDLEERLVSRFKWGLVANVAPPCYETRVAILKNKAQMRGFVLTDDVACQIAAKIDSNIRELEGAIVKLHVLSNIENRPVDLALASQALGEPAAKTDKQIPIQTIIDAVTEFFGVKVTDLQSKRRQRSIAVPRQVCMYLARRHTRYSLEEIGGYFGGRDHTTVMHAVRTIEDRCEVDQEFGKAVATIDSQVRVGFSAANI
jgi:chromosomal replication initiator protein